MQSVNCRKFTENFIRRGLARNEDDFYEATGSELSLVWHMPNYFLTNSIDCKIEVCVTDKQNKELQEIKKLYPNAMMSGSGSTYFLINDNFKETDGFWVKNDLKSIPDGVKLI